MTHEALSANRIALLDEHTANRIAAGEVVERPASVVKELVENSIDAGATQIGVTLEDGGKELIKVTDNGIGMCREDAVLSLQRHATSKIRDAGDLDAIGTLGFRGEALPSIASVSIMEVVTKCDDEPGATKLEIEAGTITNLATVGAPRGTTISVRRLFFNTPARLKFLKTSQTELSHVTDVIGQLAMAYPSVGFKLTHGGREVISCPATGSHINSVASVLGKDIARQLVPIAYQTPVINIDGFISNPGLTRMNRRDQILFVNGRTIRSRTITHAIDQAYRGLLQPGRYPVAVVFVNIAPELVDVNVHPTKAEVKFSGEHEVHSAVHRAANEALMKGGAAHTITSAQPATAFRPLAAADGSAREPDYRQKALIPTEESDLTAFREALDRRRQEAIAESGDPFVWRQAQGVAPEDSPVPEADFDAVRAVALKGVRVIGQARGTYIIAQCDDGVLLIDQHVAHERVLYDRFVMAEEERGPAIQGLVIPVSVAFGHRESEIVARRLTEIRKAGFDLEAFGKDTFVMRGAPASVKAGDAEAILREMIEELVDLSVTGHLLVRADQVLITASCKMAVKAGEQLSVEEMERLVSDLLDTRNPFTCPHGRPIIVSLSNWELDRKFRRA